LDLDVAGGCDALRRDFGVGLDGWWRRRKSEASGQVPKRGDDSTVR
jgi:hypothetical protein